jgi:hypothetical protein
METSYERLKIHRLRQRARDTRDARKIIRNFQQHKYLVNCQATLGDLRFLRIEKNVSSIKNFNNNYITS